MNIQPGTILISMPSLDDTNFEKVVVFITEHNEKGALGFVINKLFPRRLNELLEFSNATAFPLYDGGPVDKEHLFFLHRQPGLIEGGVNVTGSIYMGGNFKQAVTATSITVADIKIFIGYCGWNDTELEEEIAEGSWLITDAAGDIIFADTEMLWEKMYEEGMK